MKKPVILSILALSFLLLPGCKEKKPMGPTATIETDFGTIVIEFYPDVAPNTVKSFIKLAKEGYYDGLTFHRIVPNFVIQGGDPAGNGLGGPGYTIDAEFSSLKHEEGTVAMARKGNDINSAGSQFYIALKRLPSLDGDYTIFGHVIEGMNVVHKIAKVPTGAANKPLEPVKMKKVTIKEPAVSPANKPSD